MATFLLFQLETLRRYLYLNVCHKCHRYDRSDVNCEVNLYVSDIGALYVRCNTCIPKHTKLITEEEIEVLAAMEA